MRIGIVTTSLDKFKGGMGTYTRNLLNGLLALNIDHEYFFIHDRRSNQAVPSGVHDVKLPMVSSIPRKMVTGSVALPLLSKKLGLDVLHDPEQISPFFVGSSTARILTVHDLTPILFPQAFGRMARLYTRALPRALRGASRVIAVSMSTKRDLVRVFGFPSERVVIIPEAADPMFSPAPLERIAEAKKRYGLDSCSDGYILYLGYLEPRKNLLRLIDAYRKLLDWGGHDEALVLAGKPLLRAEEIHQRIKEKGLGDKVKVIGYVEERHLPALYSGAKLFVYPSLYEGFGLPVLEAMRCACPVLTSRTSSLPEVVGRAGVLVDPLDTSSIAEGMRKVLSDGGLRERMIRAGRRRSLNFNWENCAKKTMETYLEAAGKG